MVNTGRPSRGCILCRKRKIKCDEFKPSCRNCTKYGRQCPGYTQQPPSVGRASSNECQTSDKHLSPVVNTARSTKSCPVSPRVKNSPTTEMDQIKAHAQQVVWHEMQYTKQPISRSHSPMLQPSLFTFSSSWEVVSEPQQLGSYDQAIDYLMASGIMSTIASTITDINPGEVIRDLCRQSGPGSSLNRAVKAAALANLSNRVYRPELCMQARDEYGQAIVALKYVLGDSEKCLEDQTLATLLILRMCEILFTLSPQRHLSISGSLPLEDWQSHIEGMHALLRIRGHRYLSTKRERWLFETTWRAVRARLMMSCQEPDELLSRLENELNSLQAGRFYPLASCFTFYHCAVGRLRVQIKDLIDRSTSCANYPTFAEEMDSLIRAADDLDAGLDEWFEHNTQWEPSHIAPETASNIAEGNMFARGYFTEPTVFLYRRRISFVRVKLHESLVSGLVAKLELMERRQEASVMLQATSASFAAVDKQILYHSEVVQNSVEELLGWVAYGLGDVSEDGEVVSGAGEREPLAGDEWRKLGARTIELYVHLASLVKCEFLTAAQTDASGEVIRRVVRSFRTLQL